jgi:hypothetical protein
MLPVIAGTAFRRIDTVFEVDWTNAVPGVGSMSGTGTLYERLSAQYSVQTSPTTVSTHADFANSSSVPIGKNNTLAGLVIDESRIARLAEWRGMNGSSNWALVDSGTRTLNYATAPDGTSVAARSETPSGNRGYYAAGSVPSANRIWSTWHKAGSIGALNQITFDNGVNFWLGFAGTAPTNWTRVSVFVPASGSGTRFAVSDGRNQASMEASVRARETP